MIGEKVSDMIKNTWANVKQTENVSSFKKTSENLKNKRK